MLYIRLVEDNSRVLATPDLRYRQRGNEAKQPLESHGNKTEGKNESLALGAGRAQKDFGL